MSSEVETSLAAQPAFRQPNIERFLDSARNDIGFLEIGIWSFPGAWGLELGASAAGNWCLLPQSSICILASHADNTRPVVTAKSNRRQLMNRIIDAIEKEQQKTEANDFKVGDSVRVHTRVVEGDKERIQIFAGIVIGHKGRGLNETFTVRRISYGEGVERVFPVHSPRIAKIEVEQKGKTRRARLNYLRTRKGKEATAVRE
jgi:large subunit ribosomal protein L19